MRRREFLMGAAGAGLAACAGPSEPQRRASEAPSLSAEEADIWDLHSHIGPRLGATPEDQMDALLRFAERMGIRKLVMLAVGPNLATPAELRKTNDDYLRALERGGKRSLGFVFLNPNHLEESLKEIDRCVRDGPMVGFKLHVAKRCDSPEHDVLFRRAAELKAVVYQHTWLNNVGNMPGESEPKDVAALHARHPEVPFICGHAGGKWELGVRTVRPHPRLCIGMAGFDPQAGAVEMAVRELGPQRVIYGSDVTGRSFASQLAKTLGADLPDDAKRAVLGGNLKRLLAPILKAKGMDA
jgi:predicted TIM-barrel fold metal-dependent hydrolase